MKCGDTYSRTHYDDVTDKQGKKIKHRFCFYPFGTGSWYVLRRARATNYANSLILFIRKKITLDSYVSFFLSFSLSPARNIILNEQLCIHFAHRQIQFILTSRRYDHPSLRVFSPTIEVKKRSGEVYFVPRLF